MYTTQVEYKLSDLKITLPDFKFLGSLLFLFGCSEVNSTLLITSELTNQNV